MVGRFTLPRIRAILRHKIVPYPSSPRLPMETNAHRGEPPFKIPKLDRDMIAAIERDDPESVKLLLLQGANVDFRDQDGWTPTMLAAICGSPQCLRVLVASGANLHVQDHEGWTALMAAAGDGEADCVDILLRAGSPVDSRDSFMRTPLLICASICCSLDTIDLLLAAGADPEDSDADGLSALVHAREQGHYDIAERMAAIILARHEAIEIQRSAAMPQSGPLGAPLHPEEPTRPQRL